MSVATNNGKTILLQVAKEAKRRKWSTHAAWRVARMAIMCAMTESNMLNDANPNVAGSLALPHDSVGNDHDSVGVFQQQVPGWGSVAECQSIPYATQHFVAALEADGYAQWAGPPLAKRIQAVQVSAYADGSNYQKNNARSAVFVTAHWIMAKRTVK